MLYIWKHFLKFFKISKTFNVAKFVKCKLYTAMFTIPVSRAMLKLFKDSPGRSEIYVQQNLPIVFLQKFCLTHRNKNEEVATKALLTWGNVFKIIEHYCSLLKSS